MNAPLLRLIVPLAKDWWNFKTTGTGKALGACIIVCAPPAMMSLDLPVYQLLFALCVFSLVAFAAAFILRPRVETSVLFPDKAVTGQPVTARFRIINRSRFNVHHLAVAASSLPPQLAPVRPFSFVPALAPNAEEEASLTIVPLRRGLYMWPGWRVFTTFPFNLFRTQAIREDAVGDSGHASLVVYPRFHPLVSLDVPISARYQPGGIALSSHVGESPEYIGNREYRPGDPPRHLDHRAWARLSVPVVKEYQEEYYCRVALVLDTFVPGRQRPAPAGFPDVEAAVSIAAAIADALGRGEYIIDLFAAGPELYIFRAGRNTAHIENVLEILASVDACRTNPFRKVTPAIMDELRNISSVICVFLDWDQDRAELAHAAAEAGCSVKVLLVHAGPTYLPWESSELSRSISQYAPQAVASGGIDTL